jgi:glycosyltransferase involved in cell wall biosynthesis
MTTSITLSIIIPVFNSEAVLGKALKSIKDQTYKDFEVIIVDNQSTDNTLNIARESGISGLHIISEKDSGIYAAMNKGIDVANGEWIFFLGSDDKLYHENTLSKIIPFMQERYHVIYGNVVFCNSGEKYDGEFNWLKILNKNICHQSIFFHRDTFKMLGKYNESYRMLADWEFNLRWFNKERFKRLYLNDIIAFYNENGRSKIQNDDVFYKSFIKIIKKNFSLWQVFLYSHRRYLFIKWILRFWSDK